MQHLAIPNDIVHHFLPHFRHILMRYFQPVRVRLEFDWGEVRDKVGMLTLYSFLPEGETDRYNGDDTRYGSLETPER